MPRSAGVPRVELARLPTPIHPLPALGARLGVEIHVKRDDLTGCLLSGNKVRKLEFVLADAIEHDADVVITCGGAQSNHCRATAAAARELGLDVELLLREPDRSPVEGNLFLDLLLGATIHPVSAAAYADRDQLMAQRAEELEALGRNAYVIPEGASNPRGAMGYVRCMEEILADTTEPFDAIVTAVGSGGTLAGLVAGAHLHEFRGRIIGVPVCDDAAHFRPVVGTLLEGLRDHFFPDLDPDLPGDALVDGYVGEGYAMATESELRRIQDVATLTGLVLDPTYTNKAFGALLDLVASGDIGGGSRVLFLHTGGLFGLLPHHHRFSANGM
jgi:D-cysteine desulfhydrase